MGLPGWLVNSASDLIPVHSQTAAGYIGELSVSKEGVSSFLFDLPWGNAWQGGPGNGQV